MDEDRLDYEDHATDYDNQFGFIRMTPSFQVVSGVLIAVLIILAVSGNAITIVAYITDKRLHTVYDFFIFNLAVTDLLIGCISMPFYAIYTLKEFVWEFGNIFCKVWNVVDFTLCLESILLILLLSFDRLCLVHYGPFYSTKVTKIKARVVVIISWLIAFFLYGPAIIGWDYWVGYTTVEQRDCDVEFAYNVVFTTTAAVIEFVIPIVGLAVFNGLIYQHIRKRVILNNKVNSSNADSSSSTEFPVCTSRQKTEISSAKEGITENTSHAYLEPESNVSEIEKQNKDVCSRDQQQKFIGRKEKQVKIAGNNQKQNNVYVIPANITADQNTNICICSTYTKNCRRKMNCRITTMAKCIRSHTKHSHNRIEIARVLGQSPLNSFRAAISNEINKLSKHKHKHEHSRIKRDSKAARVLIILVIVFLACWTPYTMATIIISFCGDGCVNTSVYESMTWLLWTKSAINPFLYALNSSRYRYNFKKYIKCLKNQVNPHDTETTCQL